MGSSGDTAASSNLLGLVLASFACAAIYALFTGLEAPVGDEFQIYPYILKLRQPELFSTDLIFRDTEQLLALLVRAYAFFEPIFSWPHFSMVGQFFNYALLSLGLLVFSSTLHGKAIPFPSAVLMVLAAGHYLIASTHLTHASFYIQYTSLALTLLSLALALKGRAVGAAAAQFAALIIYPLVGLQGACLLVVASLFNRPPRKNALVALGILLAGIFAALAPNIAAYGQGLARTDMARYLEVFKFIRAPHHFDAATWGIVPFAQLGLGLCFLALAAHAGYGIPSRLRWAVVTLAACIVAAMFLGIWNDCTLASSALFLANPLKSSPLILALYMAVALAVVADRIRHGLTYSSVLLLTSTHRVEFCIVLCAVCLSDMLIKRVRPSWTRGRQDLACTLAGLCCVCIVWGQSIVTDMMGMQGLKLLGPEVALRHVLALGFAASMLFVAGKKRHTFAHIAWVTLVAAAAAAALMGVFPKGPQELLPSDEWKAVCAQTTELTAVKACVVVPPDLASFQYLSRRSGFVLLKHFGRTPDKGVEWLKRMCLLNTLPPQACNAPLTHAVAVDLDGYAHLTPADFARIANEYPEVTHAIVTKDMPAPGPVLFENRDYRLCSLR